MSVVDTTQVRRRFNPEHGVSYSRAKGRPALDSDFMEVRKRRLKKRVDAILPGDRGEDVDFFEVVGEGVRARMLGISKAPITLDDLEEQIAIDSVETWATIQKFRADEAAREHNEALKLEAEVRSPSRWFPYDRVGGVNADP